LLSSPAVEPRDEIGIIGIIVLDALNTANMGRSSGAVRSACLIQDWKEGANQTM
jgi:hypothetical protein